MTSSDTRFSAQLDEMRGALQGTLESGKTLAARRVSHTLCKLRHFTAFCISFQALVSFDKIKEQAQTAAASE